MPFSSNGHIYHKNVILNALQHTPVDTIEDFEKVMQDKLYNGGFGGKVPPLMACPEYSVVIHNALMKLAEAEDSNLDISPESINARYLKNNVIDYFSFDFSNISKPYEDFLTKFHNENKLHNSS